MELKLSIFFNKPTQLDYTPHSKIFFISSIFNMTNLYVNDDAILDIGYVRTVLLLDQL